MKKIIEKFQHPDWESYWSGHWDILSFSDWGAFYTHKSFSAEIDRFVFHAIIIWDNGKSTCYLRQEEKARFGKKLAKIIEERNDLAITICEQLKTKAKQYLLFVEKWKGKELSLEQFQQYKRLLISYYAPHIQNKVSVDYFSQEMLERYLKLFEEARVYAEPVFTQSIEFIKALSEIHAKKTGYPPELIRALLDKDFEEYLSSEKLPSKKILEERNRASASLFLEGKLVGIVFGKEMSAIEKVLIGEQRENILKGTVACPGKVKGVVRIIFDPNKVVRFEKGDILITGMTRPEYLPLMEKAAAIVTDAGGILSHAAIVARELKKPCIIGTKIATKVLKDGDLVEVDAEKGIVRKIQ